MKSRKPTSPRGTADSSESRSATEHTPESTRRRLLQTLGKGAGASAALLPVVWTRPVVDSVVLPAHGQTSDVRCLVEVTWTNDSNSDQICLSVQAVSGGADPLPPPGDCIVVPDDGNPAEGFYSQALSTGSYGIVMTALFGGESEERDEDYAGTVTCCGGESVDFEGNLAGLAGGSASETVAVVTISDDGDCTIATSG